MKINELLVESQQLDEGPFTQAIGRGAGKVARGIANIGKDLKTGFKAGYSGEQPPADAAATTTAPTAAPTQTAPVKKAGGGVIDQFKKGFTKGQEEPTAAAPKTTAAPASTPAPAAAAPTSTPAADPAAEKQSKIGVGQINKIIPTLRTRDLMSLKKNLDAVIASKQKTPAPKTPAATPGANSPEQKAEIEKNKADKQARTSKVAPSQAEIDADRDRLLPQNSSIIRTGASLSETLARKVQEQKQHMFETALANGQHSIFKK